MAEAEDRGTRLDKWLWAARFFKTRGLASQAISGGKVHLNDQRVKPSRPVRVGDELSIVRGQQHMTVVVQALSDRRGPAPVAQTLYAETDESRARRELETEQRRVLNASLPRSPGRPDKHQRHRIRQLKGKDQ
jgi:ribosome-associated heat shock protein Hsp15